MTAISGKFRLSTTRLLPIAYTTKHSILSLTFL
jgi:hypothetical protein